MKKVILICVLALSFSCKKSNKNGQESGFQIPSIVDNTPKCDNPDVIETVKSIIFPLDDSRQPAAITSQEFKENGNSYEKVKEKWRKRDELKRQKMELNTIITTEVNEKLKSCGCQATLANIDPVDIYFQGKFLENGETILYNVKTDSKREVVVELISY